VNDRLSHAVGDSVLRGVAQLLRQSCRGSDLVARYGGEEFVVLMAETAAADALRTAEKLRCAVQAHDWARLHPGLPAVTISIGVGSWDPAADSECTARDVLAAADRQLYLAKQGGKNRTCG
ncbi:MAG: GGDEF domain-containing protein, partial [Rubrivivax sp.]|nr:GGDEF domain-containing protein [Rubrivivax sp.]